MARPTIGAELSVMVVIFGMTGITIRWRAFKYPIDMTRQAINTNMLAS
jgi:hypothetical protein